MSICLALFHHGVLDTTCWLAVEGLFTTTREDRISQCHGSTVLPVLQLWCQIIKETILKKKNCPLTTHVAYQCLLIGQLAVKVTASLNYAFILKSCSEKNKTGALKCMFNVDTWLIWSWSSAWLSDGLVTTKEGRWGDCEFYFGQRNPIWSPPLLNRFHF